MSIHSPVEDHQVKISLPLRHKSGKMIITKTIRETNNFLSDIKCQHKSIGFAPTMGALHHGHISLINRSLAENDLTVASIFINPNQFNDPEDLKNYPRNLPKDVSMLQETGCNMVFIPDEKTIYPKPDNRVFNFGNLDKIMEGRSRPGHFNGVAQVVGRLFEIIKPDRAYFGEKDIQQLAIIKKMTGILKLPVEIKTCPTIRESDGLAMSSRNLLLDPEQRKNAVLIYKTLREASQKTHLKVDELKQWVIDTINENPYLEIDYFEIIDSDDLQPVNNWNQHRGKIVACIAVRAGNIRLIDNLFFSNFAIL